MGEYPRDELVEAKPTPVKEGLTLTVVAAGLGLCAGGTLGLTAMAVLERDWTYALLYTLLTALFGWRAVEEVDRGPSDTGN